MHSVDEARKQLDQREHLENRESLRWLAVYQLGHYGISQAYRNDLLPIVEPSFAQNGLPEPSGVVIRVAADGKSWCARWPTVTG